MRRNIITRVGWGKEQGKISKSKGHIWPATCLYSQKLTGFYIFKTRRNTVFSPHTMGNTGPSHRLVYKLHIVQLICPTKADTMRPQELRYIIKKSRETVHRYDNVSERAGISFRALKCEVSTSHHFRRSSGI